MAYATALIFRYNMKLEMKEISKSFGSNLVLDKVDFSLQGGEIKALLGENGAGKIDEYTWRSDFM